MSEPKIKINFLSVEGRGGGAEGMKREGGEVELRILERVLVASSSSTSIFIVISL